MRFVRQEICSMVRTIEKTVHHEITEFNLNDRVLSDTDFAAIHSMHFFSYIHCAKLIPAK